MKIEAFGEPGYTWELPFECEIHCTHPRGLPDRNRFSVLNLTPEPPDHMMPAHQVRELAPFFDLILTYDEGLLQLPNSKKLLYGDTWVTGLPNRKEFSFSFLYSRGIGGNLDGYEFRKTVWDSKDLFRQDLRFWTSTQGIRIPQVDNLTPYPFPTKDALFESMFSIVIENRRTVNYFSEKLLDALRTYTVPIYFGCPNISDFFDVTGIVQVNDISELIEVINGTSISDYWKIVPTLAKNFVESEKYINYGARLRDAIVFAYEEKRSAESGKSSG